MHFTSSINLFKTQASPRFAAEKHPPPGYVSSANPETTGTFSDYPPPSHNYSAGQQFVRSASTTSSARPADAIPDRTSSQNATTKIPANKVPPRTSSLGATKDKDKGKKKEVNKFA
jgi:hypothetical protein